jgi:hypothetical protein
MGNIPCSRFKDASFAKELQHAWASDFLTPVLELLNGKTSITNIHDSKFVLPIQRSSWLLNILCARTISLRYTRFRVWSHVKDEEWCNTVTRSSSSFQNSIEHEHDEIHRVFWYDEEPAKLGYHEKDWREDDVPQYTLILARDMECHLSKMPKLDSKPFRGS